VFEANSRYAGAAPYTVVDRRGRQVTVMPLFEPPAQVRLGVHLRLEGQRLDHLANRYLDDPAGFWRICELNGVMLADALAEVHEVSIPRPDR
jgi:hypothetical protein